MLSLYDIPPSPLTGEGGVGNQNQTEKLINVNLTYLETEFNESLPWKIALLSQNAYKIHIKYSHQKAPVKRHDYCRNIQILTFSSADLTGPKEPG